MALFLMSLWGVWAPIPRYQDPTAPIPRYQDPTAPIPVRVDDLLSRMTLQEKAAQLQVARSPQHINTFNDTGFGVTSLSSGNLKDRNAFQKRFFEGSRLHIPVAFYHESLHSGGGAAIAFPEPVTLGCTWDPELVTQVYQAVGEGTRANGAEIAFAPVLNMWTDPRNGRHQEGFSPDPTLTARMAEASVLGLQGKSGNATDYMTNFTTNVVSLGKHYAAYGGTVMNGSPALSSERNLRDLYLKPWKAFAQAGGRGIMPAHNTVLDIPCHAHRWLVDTVMRKEYGFGDGISLSDCNDIGVLEDFGIAANKTHAAAKALNARAVDLDLQCGGDSSAWSYNNVLEAVKSGLTDVVAVDEAVKRVLTMKFATGLFDVPYSDENFDWQLESPAKISLARRAAQEGTVLISNRNAVLPLDPHAIASGKTHVAVIGPLADGTAVPSAYIGSYGGTTDGTVSLLAALRAGVFTEKRATPLGCYKDHDDGDRDLPICATKTMQTSNPISECSELCAGYKFFGLQNGHECRCGNSYGKFGQTHTCNIKCTHNASVMCGGNYAENIYEHEAWDNISGISYAYGAGIDDKKLNTTGIEEAVETAKNSDVALLVLGDTPAQVGEWIDRSSLDLKPSQMALLQAVVDGIDPKQTSVVVVLVHGNQLTFGAPYNTILDNVDALLSAGRPGQYGGFGISDLLLGVVSPSGRLGSNWPRYIAQIGAGASPFLSRVVGKWLANEKGYQDPDGRRYDDFKDLPVSLSTPLFRFGHGLTYTDFSYKQISAIKTMDPIAPINISVVLANTGNFSAAEIVQVYCQDPKAGTSNVVRFWKRLIAFKRVMLKPNEKTTVVLPLLASELGSHQDDMIFRITPGAYSCSVGGSSETDSLKTSFIVIE